MTEFFIFDLEATCWSEQHHLLQQEIIEIGAYYVDPFGQVGDSFSAFVKPVIHPYLSPFCQQLTSISQEDVENSPTFDKVYPKFINWMEQSAQSSDWHIASWGSMDLDLKDIGCDFYSGSTHKWLMGPMENGVLYVRKEHLDRLWPNIIAAGWKEGSQSLDEKVCALGQRNTPSTPAIIDILDFPNSAGSPMVCIS